MLTRDFGTGILSGMTEEQVIDKIRKLVAATPASNVSEVARTLGVSPQYLHDVLNGKREPGPSILQGLGVQKVVSYRSVA